MAPLIRLCLFAERRGGETAPFALRHISCIHALYRPSSVAKRR